MRLIQRSGRHLKCRANCSTAWRQGEIVGERDVAALELRQHDAPTSPFVLTQIVQSFFPSTKLRARCCVDTTRSRAGSRAPRCPDVSGIHAVEDRALRYRDR
jgi:hypothetical protein